MTRRDATGREDFAVVQAKQTAGAVHPSSSARQLLAKKQSPPAETISLPPFSLSRTLRGKVSARGSGPSSSLASLFTCSPHLSFAAGPWTTPVALVSGCSFSWFRAVTVP
ncbi:hypothetical protein AVEN_59865-1 [Araneus ventricosus]|uniref:Uncharacterized protein n=1 Tax=Araneus ventricosus TaxID=182803 RepID=A0A4Y2FD61_ARAVE|nr:hypothetical protein AVEN_59865-1 [Araneus ventricosus]